MIHDDEFRSDAEIERLRAEEAAHDPIALFRAHEQLRRETIALRRALEEAQAAQRAAEKATRWQKAKREENGKALRVTETSLKKLRVKQSDYFEKLTASHQEVRRLREDLERVRASRTFRVGKAVLSPTRIFRPSSAPKTIEQAPAQLEAPDAPSPAEDQSATSPTPAPAGLHSEIPAPVTSGAAIPLSGEPTDPSDPTPDGASAARIGEAAVEPTATNWESPLPVAERDLATLRHEFEAHPDATTLYRVLNRSWYGHGMIDEPARLIRENPGIVEEFSDRNTLFADRILGEHRLRHQGVPLPERADGIAYTAEPERVMYCVHSTPVFNSNGYSTRTRGVATGLAQAGADVRVVARAGYPWDTKTDVDKPAQKRTMRTFDNVPYIHLTGSGLGAVPMDRYLIEAADAFAREALLQRPAVIQAASNYRTALPALIAARRLGVPFVYEIRGFWEMSQASANPLWDASEQYETIVALETLLAEEADHVLAITRQVQEELVSRGIPADKITIVPNAVDTDEFVPLPTDVSYAAARKIRTDVPVIGFAGSMVPYEGLATLLEASKLLEERGIDHQVVIAGSGSAEASLRELRSELGAGKVMFIGRRPNVEMPRLLSTFDIIPIPRLSQPVTEMVSPLKPLEAFASMKAVLLSDVAPHRDLAGTEQERARLFAAGDPSSLADALVNLLSSPDLRRALGRAARLWALDERTWTKIAGAMRQAHHAAVGAHTAQLTPLGVDLGDVTIGLIADEFTTKTISASVPTLPIDREHWLAQLEQNPVDVVFVESAWSGNGGQWHRGIGAYGADEHQDIRDVLTYCRENGIPTVFWNKEDPIHFARFEATAALCDHVFTTDGGIIGKYLATPGSEARTVSSMPFYAQPTIHNPLPTDRPYSHTVAYAGTYYGERYKERSRDLYRMLETSEPYGLTIYDRQAAFPDSPYRFPAEFARYSKGALPYDEVIDSYKSHLAHLNGNSVMNSPTMFSRRVVEIAACGGIVLSGPGRGVEETFGGLIPASREDSVWRALLHSWSTTPAARVREAWRQMRSVHRSHTVHSAMTLLLRTAGVPVRAPQLDTYAVVLTAATEELALSVLEQSVRPLEVFVPGGASAVTAPLETAGITVRDSTEAVHSAADWIGLVSASVPRTWFEDLLLATRFGSWQRIGAQIADHTSEGRTLATPGVVEGSTAGLVTTQVARRHVSVDDALRAPADESVTLLVAATEDRASSESRTAGVGRQATAQFSRPSTVLVAGHDLKFAGTLLSVLENAGHTVLIDTWDSHTAHDEAVSKELLEQADVVFCEWGLGNAVWYSKHVKPHQRLVVRVHSQELFRPYLSRVQHAQVDRYVFVGELIRRAAVESHGVPAGKTSIVPNFVDTEELALEKIPGAEKNLGLVGIVPEAKRLDLAIDVLEHLLDADPSYRLFVKGKRPEDFAWMAQRPEELARYEAQYARIEEINAAHPGAVAFDPQGDDMPEWYRKIGVALSTSNFESFHLTLPDGAVSGALPVSLAWPGSDFLYPRSWLNATTEEMAASILRRQGEERTEGGFVAARYAKQVTVPALLEIIAPQGA